VVGWQIAGGDLPRRQQSFRKIVMTDKQSSKIEFTPPKDFTPPDTSESGEFDLVCSFKISGDKLCLTKLGDLEVGCDDDEKKESTGSDKPSWKDYAGKMIGGLEGGQEMGGAA
jgi:hypothetical protein